MKCPNCQHLYDDKQVKCGSCGQVNSQSALEGLQNLEYLTAWLDEHQDELAASGYRRLRQATEQQLVELRGRAAALNVPAARPVELVVRELVLATDIRDALESWVTAGVIKPPTAETLRRVLDRQRQRLKAEQAGRAAETPRITLLDVIDFAQRSLAEWIKAGVIAESDRLSLAAFLKDRHDALLASKSAPRPHAAAPKVAGQPDSMKAASVSTQRPAVDKPAPIAAPQPAAPSAIRPRPVPARQLAASPGVVAIPQGVVAAPPRPAPPPRPARPPRPPINWAKVWERGWQLVVSGAQLRGLLYLGALMIVASAVVLVVRFWSLFPIWLQIVFVAAVPMSFYAGGFALRRLKIPVAGSVFTGIGALLVAVDLAAVYQLGGLSGVIDLPLYWLGASIFCAALYLFTLYRARGEFFGYLTLIGGGNVAVALAVALRLRPEWWVTAGAAAGLGAVAVAAALKERDGAWQDLGRPARTFAQLVLPAAVFLAAAVALFVAPHQAWALAATLALVALGYGGLAWRFGYVLAEYAAVGSSALAAGFALNAVGLPFAWLASSGAALAAGYSAAGRWLDLRRRALSAAQRSGRWAWYAAAGLLAAIGLLAGLTTLFTDLWAGVIGLVLADALLVGWARLFRRPLFSFAAAGLFVVPFTAAVFKLLSTASLAPAAGWMAAAWTALALGYLGLAAGLRNAERHARWVYLWAHVVTGLAGMTLAGLVAISALGLSGASNDSLTALITISGALAVYSASAVLHDSGRHPALSRWVAWLKPADEAAFLWPIGALLPAWLAVAWWRWALPWGWSWFAAALAGLGLAYVAGGQLLARRRAAYRLPWHAFAYALAALGIVFAISEQRPLTVTLYLVVATLAALAWAWRRPLETFVAAALFVAPFQLTLNLTQLPVHVGALRADALAYALLAALGYYPIGLRLRGAGGKFSWPVLGVGYAVAAGAIVIALLGSVTAAGLLGANVAWLGLATPLVVLALLVASSYHLRHWPFAWAAALVVVPIAYWQALDLLAVPTAYAATAWVVLAFAGLLAERGLIARTGAGHWLRAHVRPLQVMAVMVCGLGLGLTAQATLLAFIGHAQRGADLFPPLLAQSLAVAFAILAARLHRSRWPLYAVPALSFFPATLFFIAYSTRLFGHPLATAQFGLAWMGLGLAHLLAAARLDRDAARYSHGLYAGGYFLALMAVGWTLLDGGVLLWTLGLGILAAAASAGLVRADRHQTWDELITALFGKTTGATREMARGAFWWFTAWPLPVWCVLLLRQLRLSGGFEWLGFEASALLLVGLALWLGRARRSDAWPFHSAAQFYAALGLLISAPITLAVFSGLAAASTFALAGLAAMPFALITPAAAMLVQAVAVIFYVAAARVFHQRSFAHLAAWLSFVPYTLGWMVTSRLSSPQLALPWMGLAAALLALGLALDLALGRARVRYAHGPYLAGYALAAFAALWSTPDRPVQLIVLGAGVLIALASQALAHANLHHSFEDLINWIWPQPGSDTYRGVRAAFLFVAGYAFPVWLALLFAELGWPLAWRGLGLAALAPVYIGLGLLARRVRPEYAWPLYSAGYALTAVGTAATLGDELVTIYALSLAAALYAASAFIFRHAFWLYLANVLSPVIAVMVLDVNGRANPEWFGPVLMGLAFFDVALAQFSCRGRDRQAGRIETDFALPFLVPGYVLSGMALASAASLGLLPHAPSGWSPLALRWDTIGVFSAGVALYAFSAWRYRSTAFLYLAAWLAAVPYALVLDLLPIPTGWLGLSWLPLIAGYILGARLAFHRAPMPRAFLSHRAMPFYLLAYGLSVVMILQSSGSALTAAVAYGAAAAIYCGSALLYRRPAWLFPGLLAMHLGVLAAFAIVPSSQPAYFVSQPMVVLAWMMAAAGYLLERRTSGPGERGLRARLTAPWARPFLFFAAAGMIIWQLVAGASPGTGLFVAAGNALVLGLLAMLWLERPLAYGTSGFVALAAVYALGVAGLPVNSPISLAWLAALGFGFYLAARIAGLVSRTPIGQVWEQPLARAAIVLTGVTALGMFMTQLADLVATAAVLGLAGAQAIGEAYRLRRLRLGYGGVALLLAAWALVLVANQIVQPQWYAIPGGLYLMGVGYLERHAGRKPLAVIIESLGLAVVLVTTFSQSLDGGAAGLPYFILLIVEGMGAMAWGALRRLKAPFFIGLGANAINVLAQLVLLFAGPSTLIRWLIIGGTGLFIVATAVFVERQRDRLLVRAQAWREALVAWD
jgi:hypothetical protein